MAVTVLAALAVGACGGVGDERRPTAMEASRVVTGLDDLRERSDEADDAGARAALRRVRATVAALGDERALTPGERRAVNRSLARIARTLDGRREPVRRDDRPKRRGPEQTVPSRPTTTASPKSSPPASQADEDEVEEAEDEGSDGDD